MSISAFEKQLSSLERFVEKKGDRVVVKDEKGLAGKMDGLIREGGLRRG